MSGERTKGPKEDDQASKLLEKALSSFDSILGKYFFSINSLSLNNQREMILFLIHTQGMMYENYGRNDCIREPIKPTSVDQVFN